MQIGGLLMSGSGRESTMRDSRARMRQGGFGMRQGVMFGLRSGGASWGQLAGFLELLLGGVAMLLGHLVVILSFVLRFRTDGWRGFGGFGGLDGWNLGRFRFVGWF